MNAPIMGAAGPRVHASGTDENVSPPDRQANLPESGGGFDLREIDGLPRCHDAALGAHLGMARPTNIRQQIEANWDELLTYGPVHAARALVERPQGGAVDVTEYWLTEEQALLICTLSKAKRAPDVRRMLIKVFTAWRRGHLVPTQPHADLTNPDVLLPLLGQYAADKKLLLAQVEEMKPAVAALERLALPTDGAMCITDAAKDLQVTRKNLIHFLEQNGWIYRRAGSRRRMVAYQSRIQAGHLEHKLQEVDDGRGGTKMAEQVMVTPKGRALLARQISAGEGGRA
ncbi:phage antirepressor KilAC domain-containing protein [Azospirillum sp. SYSU D00513]|uniref:phage antirepressor KilAC domain-containing protein n=1 Tax=Azospirillum sp. SYSU D00513 TaxID=2812561 RepID=UPI001A974BF5|nr:phage antirepressor KilAC domain-containing protein [Azospirillum sp. SYSU D00513]